MKKYILPVAAALFVSGVVSAQSTVKTKKASPSIAMAAKKPAPATKTSTASVAGSTAAAKPATDATASKGKHHHKKTKPVTKTTSK